MAPFDVAELLQDVLPMGTYLQEYGNFPQGLMRVDSLRLGGAATAPPSPAAAPGAAPPPDAAPPPGAGGSAEGFLGRLQRAESNDEARLSYRLSQTSARTDGSSSSRREEEEEAPPPPQPSASGSLLTPRSSGAVGAEAKWMQPPPVPEPRQPPPVLEPRGNEAGVEQVPLPGTPESPPPVAATRFPDDVGTPKRDHFASSFRGLSASLSGRPY